MLHPDATRAGAQEVFRFSRERLETSLQKVPGLKSLVLEMMSDPNIDISIKTVIRKALEENDTEIAQLTDELRKQINLSDKAGGIAIHNRSTNLYWSYKTSPLTLNQEVSSQLNLSSQASELVIVPDREITEAENDLITLIHELAHVRFESYLIKNFDRISSRLPKSLAKRDDKGNWAMNAQLNDLLHEKYAHEMEYRTLVATHGSYYSAWCNKWNFDKGLSEAQQIAVIGRYVVAAYNIKDPQVSALATFPLSEILRGGLSVREIDEALSVYSSPEISRPSDQELPTALDLLRIMKNSLGQKVSRVPTLEEMTEHITDLLRFDRNGESLNKLLIPFFKAAEEQEASASAMLNLLSQPSILSLLNKLAKWTLPENRPLVWKDLAQAHPYTQIVFRSDIFPPEPDSSAIVEILTKGFGENAPDLEKGRNSATFRGAYRIALTAHIIVDTYEDESPNYRTSIREAKLIKYQGLYYINNGGWEKTVKFWEDLGLKEPFLKEFKDFESFWDSNDSLIHIFSRLKLAK